MDIRQCKKCGNLFHALGEKLCPECVDKMDQDYVKVRDYVYDNPEAEIIEVSRETGVDEQSILTFLKEERLSLVKTSGLLLCENCRAPITSGRLCGNCLEFLNSELDRVVEGEKLKKPLSTTEGRSMRLRYGRK